MTIPFPHRLKRSLFPAVAALVLVALQLSPVADIEDSLGLQLVYSARGVRLPPDEVVIVALDSSSARDLGQPDRSDRWSRRLHAQLITALAERGAQVVGIDMLFERAGSPQDDQMLADAIRRAGNVVLAERLVRSPVMSAGGQVLGNVDQAVGLLPEFRDAALATAPFVLPKTSAGVFEYWGIVAAAGDRLALPDRMAERMRQKSWPAVGRDAGADVAPQATSPPPDGRRLLNLYGPLGTVRTLRYADALALAADPVAGQAAFAGKAVLIGYSESNQSRQVDVFKTPFSRDDGVDLSGVELCATALSNLIDGSSLRRAPELVAVAFASLWAALLTLPWKRCRPPAAFAWTLLLCGAYGMGVYLAFGRGLWLPVVIPLGVAPLVGAAVGLLWQHGAMRRSQAELETAVGLGLTRRSLGRLSIVLGGRLNGCRLNAVCLATDIEGYTRLAESLEPEATRDLLNRYFARFVPIVEEHGGYITEIVADSVVSLWVADESPAQASRQAVAAALALDRAINCGAGAEVLATRLGLHYGPVFLGKVGTEQRAEIRAVGDTVNGASRIQGANKYLGSRILASAAIVKFVPEAAWRCLGTFGLAGKAQTLDLHQLLPTQLPREVQSDFAAGRAALRAGDLASANRHFAHLLEQLPDDGPTRFYHDQCGKGKLGHEGEILLPGK